MVLVATAALTASKPPVRTVRAGTGTGPVVALGGPNAASVGSSGSQAPGSSRTIAGSSRTISGPRPIYDPGVTDSSILVGGSTFTSGPAAVYGEQIAVGFQAGVNYINDHGGVNGRKLIAKIYDDAGDPVKQLANTKRLVEVDKVFALSMSYAPIAGQYVLQKKIPVFHLGQFNEEFTNPWWFSVGGAQRTEGYTIADFATNYLHAKSVAIFYLDVGAANYSKAYANQVKTDWERWGAKVPVMYGFAADQASCSDAISQAKSANVDFVDFEIDASKTINCGVNAQLNGWKPAKGWGGYLIGVPVIHEALGDFSIGMYAVDAFADLYHYQPYIDAVRNVSPKTESHSSVTASYFVAALLMRDGIAKLGNNITRERLREVLNTFTNWRPAEMQNSDDFPYWTWRPRCHLALRGNYIIQIQKDPSGDLSWNQFTPQERTIPLPPGTDPPPDFADCSGAFTRGTVYGNLKH
jgi:ABC-type branched-subunit amino acid transport system substrate-binding protein